MSSSFREAILPQLARHGRTALLGGLLVLAPIVALVHLVLQTRKAVEKAVAPLKQILPGAEFSVGGWSGLELLTLVLVLVLCWVLGLLVVWTTFGRNVRQWIERTLLQQTPVYATYRRVTGQEAAAPGQPVRPALVRVAGDWQPGVIVEQQRPDLWATVFVPVLPGAQSGQLYCVPGEHVRPLDVSMAEFRKQLLAVGRGTEDWLRTASG